MPGQRVMNHRVMKLGGSLLELSDWPVRFENWLARQPSCVNYLVVGGGALVECLRHEQSRFDYDQLLMHDLAIRCMDLNAELVAARLKFARLLPDWTWPNELPQNQTLVIPQFNRWLTQAAASGRTIPSAGWNVTSDSLAAWLAQQTQAAELVLLKSCLPEPTEVGYQATLTTWSARSYVDRAFPQVARLLPQIRLVNLAGTREFAPELAMKQN